MPLEDLEKRLSAFKKRSPKRTAGRGRKAKEDEYVPAREDDHRWLKKILLIGSGLAVIIIGLGLFFIFSYTSTSRDVGLEISAAGNVSLGALFTVDVSVTNNSGGLIKNAALTLNLPSGIVNPDPSRERNFITENVGDVVSGNLVKKTFSVVPVGESGSKQTITAKLSYAIATGPRFEDRETLEVEIGEPAIEIRVEKPEQILSGSNFSFDVEYENKSDFDFSDLVLEAVYPSAFKFDSASVPPASLNNYWQLGSLKGRGKGILSISGRLDSSVGTSVDLPVKISVNFGGQNYPVAESVVPLVPAISPLSLQLFVNNRSDYTSRVGDVLKYSIHYQNSSGIALADAKIKAVLSGDMLANGSKTIVWDSSNLPALKSLDPGASGEVGFEAKVKDSFNIQRLNDKNYLIRLSVTMDSPSVPYYLSASRTSVSGILDVKIAGLVFLSAQGFYRDLESGVDNKGDLPPRVGQATQYSIHWIVKNFSNDLNNVEVRAALGSGVRFVGSVKTNLGNAPIYDEKSGQVVWAIDRLSATKGILSEPAEAVFQIEGTPDESMVGAPQSLLSSAYLEAVDNFTGLTMEGIAPTVTTAMVGGSPAESIVVR
jgi:hypothetical protein